MPPLKLPNRQKLALVPFFESRVPKAEELVVLNKPMLEATVKIGQLLKDSPAKWALGGKLGEILLGVNVQPESVHIITDTEGCHRIMMDLEAFPASPAQVVETELRRKAEINFKQLPVKTRSLSTRLEIDGRAVEVHGNLQIRVGDWGWGDPLDFEPEYVYVVGVKVPVLPLTLKTELYVGLGWLDRAKKINEAMARRHHSVT